MDAQQWLFSPINKCLFFSSVFIILIPSSNSIIVPACGRTIPQAVRETALHFSVE